MIMGGGGGGEVAGYILLLTGWHKSSRLVRLSYMVPYLKSAPNHSSTHSCLRLSTIIIIVVTIIYIYSLPRKGE